jgi:hypothetical protein
MSFLANTSNRENGDRAKKAAKWPFFFFCLCSSTLFCQQNGQQRISICPAAADQIGLKANLVDITRERYQFGFAAFPNLSAKKKRI